MDVARLNLSHGRQDGHRAVYQRVRAASDAAGHSVGVLVDLQGPKIRLGTFRGGPVQLAAGQEFTISVRPACRGRARGIDHLPGPGRRRNSRGHRAGGRRPGGPTGDRGPGWPGPHPGDHRRDGIRPQGAQPARHGGQRARADRQGPGRPALGAPAAGRHDRAVLRPGPGGRRRAPEDHGRDGGPAAADREDRETAGPGHAGRDRGRVRRGHGRARRPGGGTPAGTGADGCRSGSSRGPGTRPSR